MSEQEQALREAYTRYYGRYAAPQQDPHTSLQEGWEVEQSVRAAEVDYGKMRRAQGASDQEIGDEIERISHEERDRAEEEE